MRAQFFTHHFKKEIMRLSLTYRQSTVSYLRFGTGKRCLICFHGFGDRAVIWYNLEEKIGKDFTIIAIDLPFHGHTEWREKTMQSADFECIVNEILEKEGVEKYALAGFSFGARIVQKLLFSHSNRIENILLFAPDGMGTKGLENATSLPIPLRRFIRFLLQKPDKIVQLINWLHQKNILGKSVYWFFSQNIAHSQRRERLFFYWLALDDFEMPLSSFKKKLQETQVNTHIFLGKHDEITPLSIGAFLTADAPHIHLHIVESDHQILGHLPDFEI
jgi:pimeloyl-ACP methyl ester carboxylesterase